MTGTEQIDKFLARLLMVSFFLGEKVQMLVVAGVSLYFIFRTVSIKQKVKRGHLLTGLFLGSGLLLYLLAVPFTPPEYRKVVLHMIERRESFLLMPLAFAIIAPSFQLLIRDQLAYFVYACFLSCTVANADFLYHYLAGHAGTHPLSHVLYRIYFEAISGLHPTYMSMYLVFSICILLYCGLFDERGARWMRYTLLYLLLFFLLTLLAKSPLIAMVVILLHSGYVHRKRLGEYKTMIIGSFLAILVTALAVPFFRVRLAEVLSLFGDEQAGNNAMNNSVDLRKLIWKIDTDVISAHWLTGVGPGRMLRMLHERYFFYSLSNQFPIGYYDPHNEYFSEWLCFGIFGLGLFVMILLVQFSKAIRVKDNLYLYLLIILSITFFTETILSRQQGVLFYAEFTSLLFFCKPVNKSGRPAS